MNITVDFFLIPYSQAKIPLKNIIIIWKLNH